MLICFPDLMSSTINLKSRQPVPDILAPGFEVTLLLLLLSQEAMLRLGEFGSSPYQVENHMKIFPFRFKNGTSSPYLFMGVLYQSDIGQGNLANVVHQVQLSTLSSCGDDEVVGKKEALSN